jgi:hypothetical protein
MFCQSLTQAFMQCMTNLPQPKKKVSADE